MHARRIPPQASARSTQGRSRHTPSAPAEAPPSFEVGVRLKRSQLRQGLSVYEDGVCFRAPDPLPGGEMIDLVLNNGAMLVDAVVAGCTPLHDTEGGYAIYARFEQLSDTTRAMLREEFGVDARSRR